MTLWLQRFFLIDRAPSRIAALLAVVLVGSQLLGAVHAAVVPHSICAEHGQAVHHDEAEEESSGARSGERGVLVSQAPPVEPHGHDHCAFLARADEDPSAGAARLFHTLDEPPLLEVGLTLQGVATVRAAVVIAFAPKLSPPIRG